jgi:di/tricarboxylate transporter
MFHWLNQPAPVSSQNRVTATRRAIVLAVLAIGALLTYGMLRFPAVLAVSSTGVRSLIGVLSILVVCAAVGWIGPPFAERIHPQILHTGILGGLLAGCVFVAEMLLEYWLLPSDNTSQHSSSSISSMARRSKRRSSARRAIMGTLFVAA